MAIASAGGTIGCLHGHGAGVKPCWPVCADRPPGIAGSLVAPSPLSFSPVALSLPKPWSSGPAGLAEPRLCHACAPSSGCRKMRPKGFRQFCSLSAQPRAPGTRFRRMRREQGTRPHGPSPSRPPAPANRFQMPDKPPLAQSAILFHAQPGSFHKLEQACPMLA